MRISLLFLATFIVSNLSGADTTSLEAHLEPFRPLLGKTWRGEFKNSTAEKPRYDIARWERALNGQAIRVLHSVNDGAYGGESIIQWNKEKEQLVYHYFTTAGFSTTGTMTHKDGKILGHEKVTGRANGINEVRSTLELRKDGTLLSQAEYFKEGQPSGDREIVYKEAPRAEVKFR